MRTKELKYPRSRRRNVSHLEAVQEIAVSPFVEIAVSLFVAIIHERTDVALQSHLGASLECGRCAHVSDVDIYVRLHISVMPQRAGRGTCR